MIEKSEYINNEIKFLAKSEIRLKILNELKRTPHTIRELVKLTGITYSSVSSNINKLYNASYIRKVDKKYEINPLSEVYLNTLMEFKQSVDFIVEFKEFWAKHNINQINEESLKNIANLNKSQLIKTTPLDIYKTHNIITNHLKNTKNLKAIFPYVHPNYSKLIEDILLKNGSIELIIEEKISEKIISGINTALRKRTFENGKLKVYVIENNLKLHLSICDETMDLGLFKNDGSFDQNRIITSNNEKSIEWANDLFENIKYQVIE
ncbi:MAG: DUF1724 domain-containing protein [Methanobrevibacter sp.]|nr:DUF1724 domain-containing protein [Methanobrevibacter sp.]